MELPKTITIGEKEYEVKFSNFFFQPRGVAGQINYVSETIKIKPSNDERMTETTFFHELAHGIFYELESNHPTVTKFRSDENFINELALHLLLVYKQLLLVEVKQ